MNNRYFRFFLYFSIVIGVLFIPFSMPKETPKKIFVDKRTINVTLIKPSLKKKVKKVKKPVQQPKVKLKKKLKPKPKVKVKVKKKIIRKPKPKLVVKKKPKPIPIKKVVPVIEKKIVVKEKVIEVKKEPIKQEIIVEKEIVIDEQEEIEKRRELARTVQAKESYSNKIYKIIAENKKYPRQARRYKKEGTVNVSFKVLRDGTIIDVILVGESKHKILNRAVLKLFKRLEKFPAPPNNIDFPLEYEIAINYKLR